MANNKDTSMQETLLLSIFEAAPLGIFSVDTHGHVTMWSPAAERTFGWKSHEVVGKFNPTIPKDGLETFYETLDKLVNKGQIIIGEQRIRRRKDGSLFYGSISAAPLKDNNGNVIGAVGLTEDITDKVKVREEIIENKQTLEAIFEASPLALVVLDTSMRITIWSRAAERIFGWKKQEILGKLNPIIPKDRLKDYEKDLKDIMNKGKTIIGKKMLRKKKDGSLIIVNVFVAPLYDAYRKITGVMGLFENISELVKAQNALKKSEIQHKTLVETMNEGLTVQDNNGLMTFVNNSFVNMIGYPRKELIGRPWDLFLNESEKEKVQKQISQISSPKKRSPKTFPVQWKSKSGNIIDTIVSPRAFFDKNEEYKGSSAVITNVSDLMKTQAKLQQRERELDAQSRNLEEINTALNVLLIKREQDKKELEEKILANVKNMIQPTIEKIRLALAENKKIYADLLEANIDEIISPFSTRLSSKHFYFTANELQVSNFIKNGMTTKEIASTMHLSTKTIEDYRKRIRKKLGITNSKKNLRTYLLSIEEHK